MKEGRDIVEPAQWQPADDKRVPVLDPNANPPVSFAMLVGDPAYGVVISSSAVTLSLSECASPAKMVIGLKTRKPPRR